MLRGTVLLVSDPAAVAVAAAAIFRASAVATRATQAAFRVALAGGRTPRALYQLLAQDAAAAASADNAAAPEDDSVDWSRVIAFFGDERCVPADHPDSNIRMVRETGFSNLPGITVDAVPTELPPREAAVRYTETIARRFFARAALDDKTPPPSLDLVILGMGPDGHTASIFPHGRAVAETRRWIVDVPPSGSPLVARITMTLPMLSAARAVMVLVTGADKREVLERVRRADLDPTPALVEELPILGVRPAGEGQARITWIVDEAAAG